MKTFLFLLMIIIVDKNTKEAYIIVVSRKLST